MNMRFQAAAFMRHHLLELAEVLRLLNLHRCARSLHLSEESLMRAREEFARAHVAYEEALADYRLHESFRESEENRSALSMLRKEESQ